MIVVGNHVPSIPSSDLFDDIMRRSCLTEDAYSPIDTESEETKLKYLHDYNSVAYMQTDWLYNRGNRIKKLDMSKLLANLNGLTDSDGDIDGDMCFFSRNKHLQEALLECFKGAAKVYRYVDKDGYRKDIYQNRLQKGVTLQSDDGVEVVQPADLMTVDNTVVVDYEKISIAQKLGYYLKMFHEGSKRKGVSMLSFIIAYLYVNHGMAASNRKDNKKYVAQSIYRVDENGNCTGKYSENHNTSKAWSEQSDWFYGRMLPEYQDIYNVHVDEFIELCERAGIDLSKEDPRDFTADVIDNITTTYIMSNMEFVDSYIGRIDSSVFKCLSPQNLLSAGSAIIVPDVDSSGCYFMDAFIDEVTEVLNANFNPDKSFMNKQNFYSRDIDEDKLYVSGIPYLYLWYYMADVYMGLYNKTFNSGSYQLTTKEALLADIKKIRLQAFRITVARIFKNPGTTVLEGMVPSSFYISSSEEYCSWKQVYRNTDLSMNDYIICERNWLNKIFGLTPEQLKTIPEKFVVTIYGCVVGQRYSSNASIRDFDVYELGAVTEFMRSMVYANTRNERVNIKWPEPEAF